MVGLLVSVGLTGCLDSEAPPFPYHDEPLDATSPDLPGLAGQGHLFGEGRTLHLAATVRNDGPDSYAIDGGCNPPFSSVLYPRNGPLGEVDHNYPFHPYPSVYSEICGKEELLGPGDERTFRFDWNGTLWDNDDTYRRPAPGTYAWHLYFMAVGPCIETECSPEAVVGFLLLEFTVVVP